MLEYLADLMEDSHNFGWQSAKGAHAVLLCKMEDDTAKIDHARRVHAQKFNSDPRKKLATKDKPIPCRYYQKGTCGQSHDHENNT